ncbi:MAG: tRNA dihydrouridine synthase DusB [Beijerinckiaceae bacterium]|nr:tRNA dihydrouridine synthase DusB [Beijerinckiaceae bacterium]
MSSHSSALRIGALHIEGRAILAPMAGVTDLGMRRLAQKFGAAFTVSEMVASDRYARGDAANQLKAAGAATGFHAVQLAGRDPHLMAEAARLAQDAGAAMIDINMGCPAKKVTSGYAGSHIMRDLGLAVLLIRATVAAVKIPVTLKMRLGWDDQTKNAPELARLAEAEGIAMLTVHGRTRCQFYTARADWRAIGKVKQAVSIPVAANGDCTSLADAHVMLVQSGADAVMIGRAAMGRPWFVGDVGYFLAQGKARGELSPKERKRAALEHFETLLEIYGTGQGLRRARKHLAAYAEYAGAQDGAELRQRVVRLECPNAVKSTLCQLFGSSLLMEAA